MKILKNYYLLLVITCLMVYLPSLWNDFQTGWDDQWAVMNRYTEDGFTKENLQAVFGDYYYGQYSPVNTVFYMMIYDVFGYNPLIFHLYSLLLHIANCCLLFLFLRQIAAIFTNRASQGNPSILVFAATLLFAVHPLQVESVCWISASKIPLYTFFILLSLLAFLRYTDTGKVWFYFVSFVLFMCAFGSKEQAIVLPATLLLLDWALGRDRKPGRFGNWPELLLEKLPFILFALFAALYTRSHQSLEYTEQVAGYPFWQRLVFACYSLVVYAGRLVLPTRLLYIYPFPMAPGSELPLLYLIYPVVVAAAIYLLCVNIRKIPRPVIFGLLFYLVNMALMLHVVPMSRFMITADRYVYLASAGLFFIAACYAVPWLQKMAVTGKKVSLPLSCATCCIWAVMRISVPMHGRTAIR
ncbi:MAG: hypothetical protein LBQ60_20565 [Bacteroidales bacterium]|jgi:hypothetical protein|nr:hypothetical protein [Bacteroidales bacterium]